MIKCSVALYFFQFSVLKTSRLVWNKCHLLMFLWTHVILGWRNCRLQISSQGDCNSAKSAHGRKNKSALSFPQMIPQHREGHVLPTYFCLLRQVDFFESPKNFKCTISVNISSLRHSSVAISVQYCKERMCSQCVKVNPLLDAILEYCLQSSNSHCTLCTRPQVLSCTCIGTEKPCPPFWTVETGPAIAIGELGGRLKCVGGAPIHCSLLCYNTAIVWK